MKLDVKSKLRRGTFIVGAIDALVPAHTVGDVCFKVLTRTQARLELPRENVFQRSTVGMGHGKSYYPFIYPE